MGVNKFRKRVFFLDSGNKTHWRSHCIREYTCPHSSEHPEFWIKWMGLAAHVLGNYKGRKRKKVSERNWASSFSKYESVMTVRFGFVNLLIQFILRNDPHSFPLFPSMKKGASQKIEQRSFYSLHRSSGIETKKQMTLFWCSS